MYCGCDPGVKSPAYAQGSEERLSRKHLPPTPRVTWVGSEPPTFGGHYAAVEGQYAAPKSRKAGARVASKQSLITLSFDAGYRIGELRAVNKYRLTPEVWRAKLWGPGLTKEQVQARIEACLTPEELDLLPQAGRGDCLDAIAIMWALALLTPAELVVHQLDLTKPASRQKAKHKCPKKPRKPKRRPTTPPSA